MPRFSLTRGGPIYRLLVVTKCAGPEGLRLWRLSVAFVAITWVPFVLIGLLERLVSGRPSPALFDLAIHVRLVVAAPLVFFAELVLDERCSSVIDQLARRFVDSGERDELGRIVRRAERWRDSAGTEALIALAGVLVGQAAFHGVTAPAGPLGSPSIGHGSPAFSFYELVVLPLFSFVMYRWFFRWIVWSGMLLRISRMDLVPMATHPDRSGGLDYLSEPLEGFAVFALATASIAAATWDQEIRRAGAPITSFVPTFAALLFIAAFTACGPLAVFVRPMYRARLRAMREYGAVMLDFVRLVHARWIDDSGDESSPLGDTDASHLADTDMVFQNIAAMRVLPIRIRFLVEIVVAPFIPMLPLVAAQIPIVELVKNVGRMALGGLPF